MFLNIESHVEKDRFNDMLTALGFLNETPALQPLANEIWENLVRETEIDSSIHAKKLRPFLAAIMHFDLPWMK